MIHSRVTCLRLGVPGLTTRDLQNAVVCIRVYYDKRKQARSRNVK